MDNNDFSQNKKNTQPESEPQQNQTENSTKQEEKNEKNTEQEESQKKKFLKKFLSAIIQREGEINKKRVRWPIIALAIIMLFTSFIIIISGVLIFAAFGNGVSGNSFQQPVSKNDPERKKFIDKYLGENSEKLSTSTGIAGKMGGSSGNYTFNDGSVKSGNDLPRLNLTSERDKEFLKNGGTRENPSLQPDRRIFDTLEFLLNGNEESRKAGFSGFSYVEVSHIVSAYEDMPINREETERSNTVPSISAHQKGQAVDITALGLVKSKCSCGDLIPIKIAWQDQPPEQEKSALAQGGDNIANKVRDTGESGTSLASLSTNLLEAELNLPKGTLSQGNLQLSAQFAALGQLAESLGLPSDTFVATEYSEQANIVLRKKIGDQFGITLSKTKISGNADIDSYLHKIAQNYTFEQLGISKLSENSDKVPANQQDKVPILTATQALEQGMQIDTSILNYDKKNVEQLLNVAGGSAFTEQFHTRAQLLANGLNWLEMAKKAVTTTIEQIGNIPEGAITENKKELAITGSNGTFDTDANTKTKKQSKTPWWESEKVITTIAKQMNINGTDEQSKKQKENLSRVLKNPQDEEALTALAKFQGLKYLDKNFQLQNGSSEKILSMVEGTAKDEKGNKLNFNQRIEETAKILADNKVFSNLEKQYKLEDGTISKILNSQNTEDKMQIIKDIGVQRLANQLKIDVRDFNKIINAINPPKTNIIAKDLPGEREVDPHKKLTEMLDSSKTVTNYLSSFGIKSEELTQFILGTEQEKITIGKNFAIKVGAKQMGFDPKNISSVSDLAVSVAGKEMGLSTNQVSMLYDMWFPSQDQKDAFDKMTDKQKEEFKNKRGEAIEDTLSSSGIIQTQLQQLGLPKNTLRDYFDAPSKRDGDKISKADVLYRDIGQLLDKKLSAPSGTFQKIGDIVNNPIYDRGDKVNLVTIELLKSYGANVFENKNNLPYKAMASLFTGASPEDIIDQQFNVGLNLINNSMGLDFFDPNDKELMNWNPNDKSQDNEKLKRYSLQNMINNKIPAVEVLARSSYVTAFETKNNLEKGSVAKIIDNRSDPKARRELITKVGGSYLDNSFKITLTDEEKKLYPNGFTIAVINGQVTSKEMFKKISEQTFFSEVKAKFGIEDNTVDMLEVLYTGRFLDEKATAGQKEFAAKMVAGDVIGTMVGKNLGFTTEEDMKMARSAVKDAMYGDYSGVREVGYVYGLNKLDGAAGLPEGTLRTVYDGYTKNNWTGFEDVGANALDSTIGMPQGTSMALKEGFIDHNWTAANAMVGSYIGGQIDKAIGAPPGSSYGAYLWLTTGNPVMFAIAILGPSVFKALGKLPILGGFVGGLFGSCGDNDCYEGKARENVHTAIEQLLRAPIEYKLPNNKVIQLITYNKERDVIPFSGEGSLVYQNYGEPTPQVYGLFAMKEAYQQLHIGF